MIAVRTDIPLKEAARLVSIPSQARNEGIAELRLRAGRRAVVVTVGGRCIPCSERLSRSDIEQCFQELCGHSVHSFSREISEGYITLAGGHRVGFCGTAVMRDGRLETLRDISSMNIRFAREIVGCAAELYDRVFRDGMCSLLLAGKPCTGKTTLLRDIARIIGADRRVALIDSRNELAAVCRGEPSLDVGENTDILCGYPKREGIMTALRTLSPDVVICDEIGGDADAVLQCIHCGAKLIATAHASSVEELYRRPDTAALLPHFDRAAVIGGRGVILEIKTLRDGVIS